MLFASLMFSAGVNAQWVVKGPASPQLAVFDTLMHNFMTTHGVTSAQLAMTRYGRLVLAHGYSLNPGSGDIVTDYDSTFRIASVSKQITSILVNRLIQEGRLSPSNTLGQYFDLTPAPGKTADTRLANVTVRNLLEHLAGFGNMNGVYDPMFNDVNIASALGISLPISQANVVTAMNGVPLNSNPGATFVYSNYGYLLLGRIIESVTGMSYGDYAASVFRPIGVWDMHLGRSELAHRGPREVGYSSGGYTSKTVMNSSGQIVPYEYGGFNIENMDSHGGWVMSAVELVRILTNLDTPTAPDAILNQASINRMFAPPQNNPSVANGTGYYAQGWSVINFGNGNLNTWHSGSLPSTSSYVVRSFHGWNYALILNRRDETGNTSYTGILDPLMWDAFSQVSQWPNGDLFPRWMPVMFRNGFD